MTETVEGLPTTPAEIYEGKIDGDGAPFWDERKTARVVVRMESYSRSATSHVPLFLANVKWMTC